MRGLGPVQLCVLCLGLAGCDHVDTTPPPCTPADSQSLPVPSVGQETSMWCWAASGQMIMNYLGGSVVQCDEANKEFGRNDCCNSVKPSACVQGGWPQPEKYGFTANHTSDTPLSWNQLQSQLSCDKKPVAFSWHSPSGGHMMVAIGYSVVGTTRYVDINDPDGGQQYSITYEYYVSGSDHTHWDDYYNFKKK